MLYMYISWCISNIHAVSAFQGVGLEGLKGFYYILYIQLEDPGVIKARPHIMYLKGLTSNAHSILPTWRSSRLCVTCVSS